MRLSSRHLLFLSLALSLAVAAFAQSGGPRAMPVEPIKDFDIVPKGDVIQHEFLIKNEGDAPLEITDVKPACGCTVARYDKTIAPGATGKVSAKVKTSDFAGPISKSIAVFTNDNNNPKLQLVVRAKIQPYISIYPGYARYNYVQGEDPGRVPQVVWAADDEPMKVLDIKSPYDYLEVSYRLLDKEEHIAKGGDTQYRVEVTLKPDAPVGPLRAHVELEIDHPKQKSVQIPISGFVRPRQHITPDALDFGPLQGDSLPMGRTLNFTNFATQGIEVTGIDTGIEALTAEVEPKEGQEGHRFKLKLTLGSEMPKGAFDTVLTIHTSDAKKPTIELPIKGSIL